MDCDTAMRAIGIGLALIGNSFALFAAILGVRMKPEDYGQVDEIGRAVFGAEKLVKAISDASRLLLLGTIAVFVGIALQVWALVSCVAG